jgi:HEAT repeat protein
VTSPPPIASGFAPEPELQEAPPFPPAPIEELLRLVVKAARAHQLYLPNNPVYRGAIEALRAAFAPIWAETDEITLAVTEGAMQWCGVTVSGETSAGKSADSLGWLFYKDGVRELTIASGFEDAEVITFLEFIQRARKGGPEEDDLVTMLWEADFTFLKYKYVDLLQDGGGGELADGSVVAPSTPGEIATAAKQAVEESRTGNIVNMDDFDATLYFLDEREIEYLQSEIRREYQHDLRTNIVTVLFDIFETQTDPVVRGEVLNNLHTLMVYLLTAGHFRGVATLLRESQVALHRGAEITPEQRRRLAELPDRLSAADALSQVLQALDEAATLPPRDELTELFDQLRPTALSTIFLWSSKIQNERLRPLLDEAAGRLATANTTELVRLIQASEPEVSSEAIRRAGALKAQAAVLALSKVLTEPEATKRQLAVHALTEIASPGALQTLERAIEDTDRDVRVTAVRALASRAYRPALARLESVVKGKAVRDADLTEKMAFFESYGALCGDAGIAHLDSLLNGKGFLGRRDDAEIRACAAIALGRIGTVRAIEALRKAAGEKDVVVRNAVTRALRGGATS